MMQDPRRLDTTMGGDDGRFPSTHGSWIESGRDETEPERRERFGALLASYWRPVYVYIRKSRNASVEDAKDLTQGFLCHLIEGGAVDRYRSAQGRFRSFLKGVLNHYLAHEHRNGHTLKRGGAHVQVALDVEQLEGEQARAERDRLTADELYDRQWLRDVMHRALALLREELAKEGKPDYLRVYEAYELWPAGGRQPSYEEVARTEGLSVDDVRNRLHRVRSRLRACVERIVAEAGGSPREIANEVRELLPG